MATEAKYFSVTETAELVREALKKNFPGIKFSVRSRSYSGGASIDVHWILGPTTREVDAVCRQYESADFDGMIDLETYKSHWLLPEGSAIIRNAPGTQGSKGMIAPELNEAPEGAIPSLWRPLRPDPAAAYGRLGGRTETERASG